ncbi:unnamed protein product [Prunus armeniaca]
MGTKQVEQEWADKERDNNVISLPACHKHLQATHKATCEKDSAHDLTFALAWARREMFMKDWVPSKVKLTIAAIRIMKRSTPLPARREIFTKD